MYRNIKAENDKNSLLNEECQRVIRELKKDNQILRDEREKLQKANLLLTEQKEKAEGDFSEVYDMFRKLDECRWVMNKQMGPGGPMAPNQRSKFLAKNLPEHDHMLQSQGHQYNEKF